MVSADSEENILDKVQKLSALWSSRGILLRLAVNFHAASKGRGERGMSLDGMYWHNKLRRGNNL